MRHYVVRQNYVGPILRRELGSQIASEELGDCADALFGGDPGNVTGGLDTEHGHAGSYEVLEQVTIVAGNLNHQTLGAEVSFTQETLGQIARMSQHRV